MGDADQGERRLGRLIANVRQSRTKESGWQAGRENRSNVGEANMSTPLSRRNKLDGLALYAPRRTREQAAWEPPADPPAPEDEPADDQIPIAAEPSDESDPQTELAEQRIEEAIRKIVALGHPDERAMPSAGHAQPTLAPRRDDEDNYQEAYEDTSRSFAARSDDADAIRIRRRSRLEAEIVPEPPVGERRSVFPLLIRLSSAMMFAAAVAYGMTMFASMQSGAPPADAAGNGNQAAEADYQVASAAPNVQQAQPEPQSPPPHLIVEDQQAFANEPLSLIVMVQHPQQNASLLLDGLAQGTKLSAGAPTSASSWQVPYNQTQGLYLYAPKDFTGVMNTAVSLLGADKQLLDTQAVQLKWIVRAAKPLPDPAPAPAPAVAQPPAKPVIVATAGDPSSAGTLKTVANPGSAGTVKPVAIKPMDPGEAAMLLQRARDFMGAGDISAARVLFNRLTDAGVADAALALASTYDPTYLATHHVMGVQGDRAQARTLYQRAKDLGSTEAAQILARMTGK